MPTTLIFRIEKVHEEDPDPLTPEEEQYLNRIEQNILVLSDTLDQVGGKQRIFPKKRVMPASSTSFDFTRSWVFRRRYVRARTRSPR